VRGFVAHSDGSFAALLWKPPSLSIAQYKNTGAKEWESILEYFRAVDFELGDGRLKYYFDVTLGRSYYTAYYKVHGVATEPNCTFGAGHESESVKYIEDDGTVRNIECWGCSHSMSMLLSYNPTLQMPLKVCLTDCYPGTGSSGSIGQIFVKEAEMTIKRVQGNCGGLAGGDLGGIVPFEDSWILTFTTANIGVGPGDWTPSSKADVGVVKISYNATGEYYYKSDIKWVTSTTSVSETHSKIATLGDNFIIGWRANGKTTIETGFAIINSDLDVLEKRIVNGTGDVFVAWGERNEWVTAEYDQFIFASTWDSSASEEDRYDYSSAQSKIYVVRPLSTTVYPTGLANQLTPISFLLVVVLLAFFLIF